MDHYIEQYGQSAEALYLRGIAQEYRAFAVENYLRMLESEKLDTDIIKFYDLCFPPDLRDAKTKKEDLLQHILNDSQCNLEKACTLNSKLERR